MFNPFRRALRLPGELGAGLITGTEKIRSGYGNGDCLLLDFRHRIFAVADATERFPQASRLLLKRLAAAAAQNGPPETKRDFQALIAQAWSRQRYIHTTTLSCVALLDNSDGPAVMIAHNGDSRVTILAADGCTVVFQTKSDMNFAGRSKTPNPVSVHPLRTRRPVVVLATDGMHDIGPLPARVLAQDPHRIAQWMSDQVQGKPSFDDMAAIALVPEALSGTRRETILMGGTPPEAESAFLQARDCGQLIDRWQAVSDWQHEPEVLALGGIRILWPPPRPEQGTIRTGEDQKKCGRS